MMGAARKTQRTTRLMQDTARFAARSERNRFMRRKKTGAGLPRALPAALFALAAVILFAAVLGRGPGKPGETTPAATEETDEIGRPQETVEPVPSEAPETEPVRPEEKDPLFRGLDPEGTRSMEALVREAEEEGALTVWSPLPEETLRQVCEAFSGRFGIQVKHRSISTNDLYSGYKKGSLRGQADVWFGCHLDPVAEAVEDGFLLPVDAIRKGTLARESYADPQGFWYAAGEDPLGVLMKGPEAGPGDRILSWATLSEQGVPGGIAMPDPNYSGDGQFLICALVQALGHDDAMRRLVGLRNSLKSLQPSSAAAAGAVSRGEAEAALCFRSDALRVTGVNEATGVTETTGGNEAGGTDATGETGGNDAAGVSGEFRFLIPEEGSGARLYVTAVFSDAPHKKAAELWTEYVLSGEAAVPLQRAGVSWLSVTGEEPLRDRIVVSDFEEAKAMRSTWINDYYAALGGL